MISSDPVVTSPETPESSFLSSPLVSKEEEPPSGERDGDEDAGKNGVTEEGPTSPGDLKKKPEEGTETNGKSDGEIGGGGGEGDVEERRSSSEGEQPDRQTQLQLSIPDLIHKDHLVEPRQKASGADTRLASTPCSGKAPYRISLSEEGLMENGAPCRRGSGEDGEEPEHHPDLLSFE